MLRMHWIVAGLVGLAGPLAGALGAQCATQKLVPRPQVVDSAFGGGLSISDEWAAVGEYKRNRVHLYRRQGAGWRLWEVLSPPASLGHTTFGSGVAIDGEHLIVGAPLDGRLGLMAGVIYSYRFDGGRWRLERELWPTDTRPLDNFGWDVALSPGGRFLAVGAYAKSDIYTSAGAVYVYERVAGAWVERQRLDASDVAGGAQFGHRVRLSEDTLLVTAQYMWPAYTGAAYVFELDEQTGRWFELQRLSYPAQLSENFGRDCDLRGDRIIVGAPDRNNESGAAFLFERVGGSWVLAREFGPNTQGGLDHFGHSVALLGDSVLIQALGDEVPPAWTGVIYQWRETIHGWERLDRLTTPDGAIYGQAFGLQMAAHRESLFVYTSLSPPPAESVVWVLNFTEAERYCPSSPNSTGRRAQIDWGGSTRLRESSFSLLAAGCPPQTLGVFFYGSSPQNQPFGNGRRCVGGRSRRLPPTLTDSAGQVRQLVDPVAGDLSLRPGSTWHFQFWFRDPAAGGPAFDLSDALTLSFCD